MKPKFSIKESLLIFLKGILMGSADIVPGVSGGTIALIVGIYSRLIEAINGVFNFISKKTFGYIFTLNFKNLWKRFIKIDFALLIPLFMGIGVAMLTLSHGIEYLLENFIGPTYAFFFGLILASAYFVYKKIDHFDTKTLLFLIVGGIVGFVLTGLKSLQTSDTALTTFIAGSIAITAMILPGISGSAMLVIMGQYERIIGAIKSLNLKTIFVFGMGALVGILAFSKVLTYLIHEQRKPTFGFLIGLMLGSLRLQIEIIKSTTPDMFGLITIVITGIVGFGLVLLIEKIAPPKGHDI